MLALTRKIGQMIIITLEDGREIELILLELKVRNGQKEATIGIEADKSIKIMRREIVDRKPTKPISDQDGNTLEHKEVVDYRELDRPQI
jgi:sRNA-binding carbon storage regulator CsrA